MSFEAPEVDMIEKIGIIGKTKIVFHIINLEWTVLFCSISFVFGISVGLLIAVLARLAQ